MDGWTTASLRDIEGPANDGTDSSITVTYRTARFGHGTRMHPTVDSEPY